MTFAERAVESPDGNNPARLNGELQTRVADYLLDRDEVAFRSLQIEVDCGTVTLTGRVESYYEKQVAASCLNVAGVLNLINNLTVPEWESDAAEFPFKLE